MCEKKSITAPAFLEKLYEILENPELDAFIAWQPDGLSFLIKQPNGFSETILPNYFKHNNIQSFVRQLNMYSFTKTRHDSNYREFRQPNFKKGRRDLLALIKRKTQAAQKHDGGDSHKPCFNAGDSVSGSDPFDDDMDEGFGTGAAFEGECSSSSSSSADIKADSASSSSSCQIDELRSYIEKLESQVWTLNERHRVLSSKYEQLQERFTAFERVHGESLRNNEDDDKMCRDSDNVTEYDQSRYSPTCSSASMPIVRMISIDPGVGRKPTGGNGHHSRCRDGYTLHTSSLLAVGGLLLKNKRDPEIDPDCRTPKATKCDHARTVQGGLLAIAAAASLLESSS